MSAISVGKPSNTVVRNTWTSNSSLVSLLTLSTKDSPSSHLPPGPLAFLFISEQDLRIFNNNWQWRDLHTDVLAPVSIGLRSV